MKKLLLILLLCFTINAHAAVKVLGDEEALIWFNGSNFWSMQASGSLASDISWVWPANAGSGGQALLTDGTNILSWGTPSTSAAHDILSATHSDSVADAVTRGSIIYGNATPRWDEFVIGTGFLKGDGTDVTGWSTVTLTTDTTGNYVASITDGLAIDGGDGGSEGAAITLAFDPTELLGNRTWGDASTDTIVWTWDRATGTDPTMTFGNDLVTFNGDVAADELILTAPAQDFVFGARNPNLTLQSQTSGEISRLEHYSADGDGTDDVLHFLLGYGIPTDLSNFHTLTMGWVSGGNEYQILTQWGSSGASREQDLVLFTETAVNGVFNTNQLVLHVDDGSVSVANNFEVGNNVEVDNDITAVGTITADDEFFLDAYGEPGEAGGKLLLGEAQEAEMYVDTGGNWEFRNLCSNENITFFTNDGGVDTEMMDLDSSVPRVHVRVRLDVDEDVQVDGNLQIDGSTLLGNAAGDTTDIFGVATLGDSGIANYTQFSATGDLSFFGSAGFIQGHMHVPGVDITVDTSATANPVEVADDGTTSLGDGWASTYQNETTFAASDLHYITITIAGTYEVIWDYSVRTAAGGGTVIHGGITIDTTTFVRNNGESHTHIFNANDDVHISSVGVIDCPNGNEEISLWISNDANQKTIIEHGNMRVQLIGGT